MKNVSYDISKSTFNKYKPCYIVPATEREKESCLCGTCLDIHCLLKAINHFRKSVGQITHASVTEYLNKLSSDPVVIHQPELTEDKQVGFHQFEKVTESYITKMELKVHIHEQNELTRAYLLNQSWNYLKSKVNRI